MKKLLSIALIAMMVLSCFSFAASAEVTYDSTWSIVTDKDSYNAGDYMRLTITNSDDLLYDFSEGMVHFTFDEGILEYTTKDDMKALRQAGFSPSALPGACKISGVSIGENTEIDGEFISALGADGAWVFGEDIVYEFYFKVKADIIGVSELNFRWVLNENDKETFAAYWDSANNPVKYSMNYVDKSVKIVGATLDSESEVLPMAYANASENDLGETTINGVPVNITTNYAVAFGKVAARKADAVKVKAGFLLSTTADNMVITNTSLTDYEAVNFSSDNMFGGLFYGPGLKSGVTYFVMPYVTYSDDVTLYASEAVSFTMPE